MKKSSMYLLYYRAPYEDSPELLCICEDLTTVHKMEYFYNHKYPDAYPDINRFEHSTCEYYGGADAIKYIG